MILKACMGLFQPIVQDDSESDEDELAAPSRRGSEQISENTLIQFAKLIQLYLRPTPRRSSSTTVNPLKRKEVDRVEDSKQRSTESGKDAGGRGEDTDSDENDNINKRRKRTKGSKVELDPARRDRSDSPDSHEGAFPGDGRQKSLGQKGKDRTRNVEATKEASSGESTNEGQYVANTLDTFPTPPISGGYLDLPNIELHWALGPEMSTNDVVKALVLTGC
ncbi:MAG: hypothetical protein M1813_006050 [Trichoglossum hirsutum]|nr:MAG: hypothetical protein M1813_006050 [Trichoglossum hirsutum]